MDYSILDFSLCPIAQGLMDKTLITREYQIFLDLLREVRQRAGVTQEELSKRLAATQSFVSKCERGERRMDVVELRTWCQALGIAPSAFMDSFDHQVSAKKTLKRRAPNTEAKA